jgi:hypothetical protein
MAQNEPKGGKQEGGQSAPQSQTAQGNDSGSKPVPSARQELQARREAAAKAEAAEKGKNLANEVGKASDLEAQKAVQGVVIQAMGFTPGFDVYSKSILQDAQFYKSVSIYNNQKNIENRATLRMFGGNDKLHNEMVDLQYKGN